jgi:hypothetical protein
MYPANGESKTPSETTRLVQYSSEKYYRSKNTSEPKQPKPGHTQSEKRPKAEWKQGYCIEKKQPSTIACAKDIIVYSVTEYFLSHNATHGVVHFRFYCPASPETPATKTQDVARRDKSLSTELYIHTPHEYSPT